MRHIRDPERHQFDGGIEERRLKIYRELFFNNILGFLQNGFPVLHEVIGEQNMQRLARGFFAEHDCRSPYFVEISKEFVEYLANEYERQDQDPVFLAELAHYEWMELDVSTRKDSIDDRVWREQQVNCVSFSPLASLVSYPFPVHQIRADFMPEEPAEPTYLVIFRQTDDEVKFIVVTPATALLLNIVEQYPSITVSSLIEHMSQAMPQISAEQLTKSLGDTMTQLLSQQILLPD